MMWSNPKGLYYFHYRSLLTAIRGCPCAIFIHAGGIYRHHLQIHRPIRDSMVPCFPEGRVYIPVLPNITTCCWKQVPETVPEKYFYRSTGSISARLSHLRIGRIFILSVIMLFLGLSGFLNRSGDLSEASQADLFTTSVTEAIYGRYDHTIPGATFIRIELLADFICQNYLSGSAEYAWDIFIMRIEFHGIPAQYPDQYILMTWYKLPITSATGLFHQPVQAGYILLSISR